MSDYGGGYTFDSSGNVVLPDYTNTPYPGEVTTGGDPADTIVSGSFGNNGGSAGDNGADGGGSAGTDLGTGAGSQGQNPGAPTQADINTLTAQGYTPQQIQTILGSIAQSNPSWASQLGSLVAGGVRVGAAAVQGLGNALTGGSSGTGAPGGGSSGGGGGLGTTNTAMLIPAMATALQQYNNANQYTQQAQQYATQLNPYGAYRDAAAQQLAALQADPSSVANTPGYQFALSQMMGAAANRDNNRFGVGAGSTTNDMMTQAQGLASKTYNDTVNQLSNQAGVNITPSAAAGVLQTGMQGSIASQNNAVNALLSPFGPGNNTGGGNTQDTSSLVNSLFGGNSAGTNSAFPTFTDTTNPTGTGINPLDPNKSNSADTTGDQSTGGTGGYTIDNSTGGPNGTGYGSYAGIPYGINGSQ